MTLLAAEKVIVETMLPMLVPLGGVEQFVAEPLCIPALTVLELNRKGSV